jgi:hypothetical protein
MNRGPVSGVSELPCCPSNSVAVLEYVDRREKIARKEVSIGHVLTMKSYRLIHLLSLFIIILDKLVDSFSQVQASELFLYSILIFNF